MGLLSRDVIRRIGREAIKMQDLHHFPTKP